jgi:uncharacterized phage infection (PIP) family protein YhgE
MKQYLLPALIALSFAACQNNTSTPAPATQESQPGTKVEEGANTIAPAKINESSTAAKALLQDMQGFLKEVNTASSSLKGAQKTAAEGIASQLNDGLGKLEMMSKALEGAASLQGTSSSAFNAGSGVSNEELMDYMGSIPRYQEFLGDMRKQFGDLKAGGK